MIARFRRQLLDAAMLGEHASLAGCRMV